MNFYEQEMRKLFGDSDVIREAKYSGKTLLGKLDDELRVKLQFIITDYADRYNALRLKIINRTEGEIDTETFRFHDILGDNPAFKERGFEQDIYIWDDHGKADWYGYHPSPAAMEKISDTITDYIAMYQEEAMDLSM